MVSVRKFSLFLQCDLNINTIVPRLVAPMLLAGHPELHCATWRPLTTCGSSNFSELKLDSYKFGFSVTLVTCQVLNRHVGLTVNLKPAVKQNISNSVKSSFGQHVSVKSLEKWQMSIHGF